MRNLCTPNIINKHTRNPFPATIGQSEGGRFEIFPSAGAGVAGVEADDGDSEDDDDEAQPEMLPEDVPEDADVEDECEIAQTAETELLEADAGKPAVEKPKQGGTEKKKKQKMVQPKEEADLETLMAAYEVDELLIGDLEKGKDGPPLPDQGPDPTSDDEEDVILEPEAKKLKHLGSVWLPCLRDSCTSISFYNTCCGVKCVVILCGIVT